MSRSTYKKDLRPWPVDFKILELLPDKGLLGGVHWVGRRVKDVTDEINKDLKNIDGAELVNSAQLTARLTEMKKAEYVEHFPGGAGGMKIWARTEEGRAYLDKKEEYLV